MENKADQFIKNCILDSLTELVCEGAIKVHHHIVPGEVSKYTSKGEPIYSYYNLNTSIEFRGRDGLVTPAACWQSRIDPHMFIRDELTEEISDLKFSQKDIEWRNQEIFRILDELGNKNTIDVADITFMKDKIGGLMSDIYHLENRISYLENRDKPY